MKLYDYAVIEKPVIALSFMFLITILLSIGLKDFKLDASADSLTLERDADLEFHRQVSTRYGTDNFLVVTFKPNTGSLFDDANLDTIKIMSEELSKVDGVLDVSSIVNVPLLYSPKITIEALADEPRTLLSKGIDKDLAITEFLESPIYRDNILSENVEITAILLTIAIDKKYMALAENRDNLRQRANEVGLTTEETKQLDIANTKFNDYQTIRYELDHERVRQVRLILDQYSDRGTIFLGGPDMITADLISFIKKDLVIYGIGIVIFMLIILSLIFKESEFVILPLISCTSCVLIVLGSLSWLGWKLTIISSNFILLLIILTLAINVHLIVRFRELSNIGNKLQTKSNVQLVVKTMLKPCFYTMLTTIVAFLSLVTSNIRPVIDFGIMMTIGVSCAFLTVFVLIPATLCLFCDKRFKTRKDLSLNITHKLAMVTEKYGTQIIAISLGLCAFGIIGISQLKVENKFIDFFHS
ncbi:MAG: MMPL family transporter, partial [Pseudomonadota bacterium]|nr:MMPL family transporter [Pseudomonadota bacterium]